MLSIGYTSATTRERFDLSSDSAFAGEPSAAREDQWDYKTGYRGLSYAARKTRSETVVVAMLGLAAADALRRAADADVAAGTPGTIDADGWSQRCYIAGASLSKRVGDSALVKLTLLLLDGVWRKAQSWEFRPGAGSGTVGVGHGYDYGYDYGYAYSEETSREIEVASVVASPFRIVVYGPAVRPSVTIGRNRYQVTTDVPDAGYLLIDSVEGTVTRVARNGYRENCLPYAVLGTGAGGGSYIFEDVPAGTSSVSYDGSFGWDLDVYREDGAVPWTSS